LIPFTLSKILQAVHQHLKENPADISPYFFRFPETFDVYSDYGPDDEAGSMGRWKIYGTGLLDVVLEKVYHLNAKRLLK
jgi:hypothetical protein